MKIKPEQVEINLIGRKMVIRNMERLVGKRSKRKMLTVYEYRRITGCNLREASHAVNQIVEEYIAKQG